MPRGNRPKHYWRDLIHVCYTLFILLIGFAYNYDSILRLPYSIRTIVLCALGCFILLLKVPGKFSGYGLYFGVKHFQPIWKRARVCYEPNDDRAKLTAYRACLPAVSKAFHQRLSA